MILFYAKGPKPTFNKQHMAYDDAYVAQRFRFADPDGRRWSEQNLASPNPRPNLTYPFTAANGITYEPPANGWKFTPERLAQMDREGRLHYPAKAGGRLRQKNYLDEGKGVPVQDVWTDISRSAAPVRSVWATPRKSRCPSSSASSSPVATPATWFSIRSADAAQRSMQRRNSGADG